ncbi:MAG: zinc-ribbon domain containing protein [Candidatus Gracilibacteria bacterium]
MEQKICKNCEAEFVITDKDTEFYKKIDVPHPTLCPDCRHERRLAIRNESSLYKRKCDLCGKDVVAIYSPDKPFKQYCNTCFFGDKWDGKKYGRDFDFSRAFMEQFLDLQKEVPKLNTGSLNNENSEYTNFCGDCKNCYMTIASEKAEDCYYCKLCQTNRNCCDCDYLWDSELCYDCTNIRNCYNCVSCVQTQNSSDCSFSYDLGSCKNCIFCFNLRNKEYHIFNKKYSKKEFQAYKDALKLNTFSGYKSALTQLHRIFLKDSIHKSVDIVSCENSTGDNLKNCKNATLCFDMQGTEECAYCAEGDAKYCYDCNNIYYQPELSYEIMSALQLYNCKFSFYSHYCNDITYCDSCYYSSNLFGCVGLQHAKYCILNKQYAEEEYKKLVPKIIERMKEEGAYGEFFPISTSPFAYNETIAQEWFYMTKEQALEKGYKWKEKDNKEYMPQKAEPPDDVNDASQEITKEIFSCDSCGKNYKLINPEFDFYKKSQVPIPRECPSCRHAKRISFKNPHHLWTEKCAKCQTEISTTYPPQRKQKIYCEKCYVKAII